MNLFYKNNFMVIDEGFSAADNINIHKFQNIMELIKKEYDICILISHIDEIKNTKGKIMKIKYDTNTKDSNINII
jgi:ABC-type proline/glycine betaine transport system ATPase subunit